MENLWNACKEEIKKTIGEISFDTWVSPLNIKKLEETSLTLEVPDGFFQNWVETHYLSQIKHALKEVSQKDLEVNFEVNPNLLKRNCRRWA